MNKEEVIIEDLYENKVSVIPYDSNSLTCIEDIIEVLSRKEAFNKYEVVGEVCNGVVKIYGKLSENNDLPTYEEFYGIDDADD